MNLVDILAHGKTASHLKEENSKVRAEAQA